MEVCVLDSPGPSSCSAWVALGGAALVIEPVLKRRAARLLKRLEQHHAPSHAHSLRVARLTMAMRRVAPEWVGCAATALLGSVLHDLGKLYVPTALLASEHPLSPEQRSAVMAHSAEGAVLAQAQGFPAAIVEVVAHHHERWAGGGYPSGRSAREFSRLVRAVAVADAFTAMTEPGRAYRLPLSREAAFHELEACRGTHFDPEAVALLVLGHCQAFAEPGVGRRHRLEHLGQGGMVPPVVEAVL